MGPTYPLSMARENFICVPQRELGHLLADNHITWQMATCERELLYTLTLIMSHLLIEDLDIVT